MKAQENNEATSGIAPSTMMLSAPRSSGGAMSVRFACRAHSISASPLGEGFLRRIDTTSSRTLRYSSSRRSSSRRRLSLASARRFSRAASDDWEDLAMVHSQIVNSAISKCVHALPMKPHGLCVASLIIIASTLAIILTLALILRNLALSQLEAMPPFCLANASLRHDGNALSDHSFAQTQLTNDSHVAFKSDFIEDHYNASQDFMKEPNNASLAEPNNAAGETFNSSFREDLNKTLMGEDPIFNSSLDVSLKSSKCSGLLSLLLLLIVQPQGSNEQSSSSSLELSLVSEAVLVSWQLLWLSLGACCVLLLSSCQLFAGIWHCQRRRLVPWLLVSGIAILLLITTSVWLLMADQGWSKLWCLLPLAGATLLLYWWLLINDLLELIHEEKKEQLLAKANADLEQDLLMANNDNKNCGNNEDNLEGVKRIASLGPKVGSGEVIRSISDDVIRINCVVTTKKLEERVSEYRNMGTAV